MTCCKETGHENTIVSLVNYTTFHKHECASEGGKGKKKFNTEIPQALVNSMIEACTVCTCTVYTFEYMWTTGRGITCWKVGVEFCL